MVHIQGLPSDASVTQVLPVKCAQRALFDDIVMEVKERVQFILEMKALGEKYDLVSLQGEIAYRLRELEKVDPERAREHMSQLNLAC